MTHPGPQELFLDGVISNVAVGLSLLAASYEGKPRGRNRLRILFVTKFPPLIGGVASQQYWRARRLAQLGHDVTVVTDANDASSVNRTTISASDLEWLNFECQASRGRLRTLFTEPTCVDGVERPDHAHIPNGSMAFSKLRGLAMDVAERERPDVVVVGYLEPYASVACELQSVFGIPACLGFAGSDMGRLARVPELGRGYGFNFSVASSVLATWEHVPRLFAMGMRLQSYLQAPPPLLPDDVFTPRGSDTEYSAPEFRIGIYGKAAPSKCWRELLEAIASLRRSGRAISLLGHIGGKHANSLRALVRDLRLEPAVELRGPIMPWRVPEFVRGCDAVCCLESGFPLEVHEPIVPYEVAKLGVLPIVSSELAAKIRGWADGTSHAVTVADPRDPTCLEEALWRVSDVSDRRLRRRSRAAIAELVPDSMHEPEATAYLIGSIERASRRPVGNAGAGADTTALGLRTLFHAYYSATVARLGVEAPTREALDLPPEGTRPLAYLNAAGRSLLAELPIEALDDCVGVDCLLYELARVVCFDLGASSFANQPVDRARFGDCFEAHDEDEQDWHPTPLGRVVVLELCTDVVEAYGLRRRRNLIVHRREKRSFAMLASSHAEPVPVLMPPGGERLIHWANGQRTLADIARVADVDLESLTEAFKKLRDSRVMTLAVRKSQVPVAADPVLIGRHLLTMRPAGQVCVG